MSIRELAGLALVVLLTVGGTRLLWPRTETIQLPGSTDTVTVTRAELDTVVQRVVQTRTVEVHDTDTLVLADTVWQTAVETVAVLEPRWYLDTLVAGRERGDSALFQTTFLAADSSSILRRDALERQVQLGPVRQVSMDREGLHVAYWPPERGGVELPLGIRLPTELVCGAVAAGTFGLGASLP